MRHIYGRFWKDLVELRIYIASDGDTLFKILKKYEIELEQLSLP